MVAVCKFFNAGKCRDGDLCHFSHAILHRSSHPSSDGSNISSLRLQGSAVSSNPCSFFLRGRCTKGSACTFSHDALATATTTPAGPAVPLEDATDSRGGISCTFYAKGKCGKGNACPYAHVGGIVQAPAATPHTSAAEVPGEDESPTQAQLLLGAMVTFQDGCQVAKVSLPSDFSAVLVHGSATQINRDRVSEFVRRLGFDQESMHIQIYQSSHLPSTPASLTAYVRVESRDFAQRLDHGTEPETSALLEHFGFKIEKAPQELSIFTNSRRTSCRKVRVSWLKPSPRKAWLNFGSEQIAQRVYRKFKKGTYKILGEKIEAERPKYSDISHGYNAVAWTVAVNKVPSAATKVAMTAGFGPEDQPRHVELSLANSSYDPIAARVSVKALLMDSGAIEVHDLPDKEKRFHAAAYFRGDSDARKAVRTLGNQPQKFLDGRRLDIALVVTSKFKIATNIYDALSSSIADLAKKWKGSQYIEFKTYRNTDEQRRFTLIKLDGSSAKDVSSAALAMEELLAGQIVRHDGATFWNSALLGSDAANELKDIQKDSGVVIIRNRAKKELKMFGPLDMMEKVEATITARFTDGRVGSHVIFVDQEQMKWALNGGLEQMRRLVGESAVTLDVVVSPRQILLLCTAVQHQECLNLMLGKTAIDGLKSFSDCCICFCEPESPLSTICGHTYCLDCFENNAINGSGNKDFYVSCQAAECGTVISLSELGDHLSSSALRETMLKAFTSYISRHQDTLRYCPTPDCGYIYRATPQAENSTCPNCVVPVCTHCHGQHSAMSCAEYKDLQSGGQAAFERYKEEKGIKDCPRCKTSIEKTDGCNHMTCVGCKMHICWVCLATFAKSGLCYEHMTRSHGGCMDLDEFRLRD